MGQWLSSREFAKLYGYKYEALKKACIRAYKAGKNFCNIKCIKIHFTYTKGIGRGGKVLQIWSEPFNSEAEAEAFIMAYRVDMLEKAVKQSKLNTELARLERAIQRNKVDSLSSMDSVFSQYDKEYRCFAIAQHDKRAESTLHDKAVQHDRIESSNIKDIQQNKANSDNTQSKDIESNRASINTKLDTTMGGVVDSHNSLCNDLYVCDDGGDDARDVSLSLNMTNKGNMTDKVNMTSKNGSMTNKSNMTDKQETNLQNVGQKTQDIREIQDTEQDNLTPFDFATTKARRIALEKKRIVKEWESLKKKGVLARDFIAYVNANRESGYSINKVDINEAWLNKAGTKSITQGNTTPKNTKQGSITHTKAQTKAMQNTAEHNYTIKLSLNKLYAWQRAYKERGLDGLLDTRGYTREGISKIQELGLDVLIDKLLLASRGRINISSIHNQLHIYLDSMGLHSYEDFLAKKSEYVSYAILERYIRQWKRNNILPTSIIHKGEDKVIGNFSPALGNKSANITRINERVEIDSTKLDVIINIADLARTHGLAITKEDRESWQKRYCLIGLIDVYSGVRCYHLSDTENSTGIARAIAKYISLYGKPECLVTDNGRAFKSKELQEILVRLDIKHSTTKAYSGQDKPFIERSFGELQNHLSEWVRGYIGHNVEQRTAIESFFSRATRRLKRGQKSNIKDLYTLQEMQKSIDSYTTILNNKYSQRLEKTHREAYNEQSSEAIAINPHILHSHLSKLQLRHVNKKGICYGGIYYSTPSLFNHTSVYVAQNINNIHELYVYDTKHNFIDIAHNACAKEISVEEAKMAQKVFKKVLKDIKTDMEVTRDRVEHELKILRDTISMKLPKTTQPKVPAINNINMEVALNQSKARRASGDGLLEIADKALQYQEDKREIKRDLSFEAAVLNLSKNKERNKK